jgi:hypothetical protein
MSRTFLYLEKYEAYFFTYRRWIAATLTACGGGGSAASTPTVVATPAITPTVVATPAIDLAAKYEGKWIACVPATSRPDVVVIGTQRVKETLTIIKSSLTTFSYNLLQEDLPNLQDGSVNLNCTGTALTSFTSSGSASIVGSKSVSGPRISVSVTPGLVVVEKLDLTESSPSPASFTDIAYFSGNTFQLGLDVLANDGYPDGLLFIDYVK